MIRRNPLTAGFTLVETLLAAAMGGLLLAAVASSAGVFSETIAQLDAQTSDTYEAVLARINRDVRYAWSVDVPSRDRLLVTGPDGLVTEYYRVGNSLMVERPDGSTGAVVTGLTDFAFTADSMQRLRSGRTTTVSGAMSTLPAPNAVTPVATQLAAGSSVAIGFMPGSDAGARMVAGTSDRYTQWTATALDLAVTGIGLGTVTFSIYPAFGPGRGEPRTSSSALATWSMNVLALPVGTIIATMPRILYAAPTVTVPIAIPSVALQPGVAYTTVIEFAGLGRLNLPLYGTTLRRDELTRSGSGSWSQVAGLVPFTVRGDATCTTTSATDVATQVRTIIETDAGHTYVGSACVYTQVLAEDPWQGVVPGETPSG